MDKKDLIIGRALKFGWDHAGKNWLVFAVFFLAIGVINCLPSFPSDNLSKYANLYTALAVAIGFIFLVASVILEMGFVKVLLAIVDGKKVKITDLFVHYKNFFSYFIVNVLYLLIVTAGLLFLIVPGVYWAIKYRFAPFLVIDQGMKPVEALHMSGEMTRGFKWDLLGFAMVKAVVIFLGLCVFGIGVFPAIIVASIANAVVYRDFLPKKISS
ncbi:MAG: hypothetical protein WCG48_00085 [Candidatus Berkelbacteria bacterium]